MPSEVSFGIIHRPLQKGFEITTAGIDFAFLRCSELNYCRLVIYTNYLHFVYCIGKKTHTFGVSFWYSIDDAFNLFFEV